MAIVIYQESNIKALKKGDKILVDEDFVPKLNLMNAVAVAHKMMVWVTNSWRKDGSVLSGAIVKPADMSNHKAGHAIDCNLQHIPTGEYFNSTKMGDGKGLDESFIQDVINQTGLFWGGKWQGKNKDEVHFDDRLNVTNPTLWKQKYAKLNKS